MSNNQNMFEVATRSKLRFHSTRGELDCERLWEVPLRSKDDFNLDVIAKATNKALKEVSQESFVDNTKTQGQARLELTLDILKYVIDVKKEEEATAKRRAENQEKKRKLVSALADKEASEMSEMSKKDIIKQINALDDD